MHCCWTLHNELSTNKEAINLLKSIDFNNEESMKKVSLETFREELQKFLIENNLPEEITKDEWFQFRRYFLHIISDIPLINDKASGFDIKEFCLVVPFGEISENNRFLYRVTYGNGEIREMGILLSDYDRMTKRKEDREGRKFWRRHNMKIFGRRIEHAKTLKDKEKGKFEKETEEIYQRMKQEEEKDAKEAQDDMMVNLISGGLNH